MVDIEGAAKPHPDRLCQLRKSCKHTKVYQEAKEEGKLEVVPKLLQRGLSLQEIAEILEVDVETVRKAAR